MDKKNQKEQDIDQKAAIAVAQRFISFLKKNNYQVHQAYLFGSYASGKFDKNSDIDLALVMYNLSNSFLMQMELMKLSWKFDSRIEPHPLDISDFDDSTPFTEEILETGIRVI